MTTTGKTSVDAWTVEDLVDSVNSRILGRTPVKKRSIELPKYQRSLVWSEDARKDFIASIKKGFPFGSLLLYKVGEENGVEKYTLIDGLQRTSTLVEYTTRPTSYFQSNQVTQDLIESIFTVLAIKDTTAASRQNLTEIITSWIISREGFEQSHKYGAYYLAKEITSRLNLSLDKVKEEELIETLVGFTEQVERESNILNAKIPIVVYFGAESNLPTIFEKINSRGTKLNKYQIFAASWATIYGTFKIQEKAIKEHIKSKYDSLNEAGFQIADYDPDPKNFFSGDFTYFEYVFGLGKLLVSGYPQLFGIVDEDDFADSTESIGFNLCTACLGLDLREIINLPEELKRVFNLPDGQKRFREALEDATSFVSNILNPVVTLQANKKKNYAKKSPYTLYHTELQIVSLIAKAFICKYDIETLKERPDWKTLKKNALMKSMEHHYVYDIINDDWRGSGDIKVNQLAQLNSRYDNPISRTSWNNLLDEWFERQLQRSETTRVNIKGTDILFLKVIYANTMVVKEDKGPKDYEIEHLVPFARLRDSIIEEAQQTNSSQKGLPISTVSNLCLLRKDLNNDKKEKTIYEYYSECVSSGSLSQRDAKRLLTSTERFTFTKDNELLFVTNSPINRDEYFDFLRKRFSTLKELLYKALDV